ncbi:hypothetical protein LBMAG53_30730 [Planctomycetota bacterium]|nr:hypothetical protein LBMAG53_30730 [Planctomycetota bacterium]
MPSASVASRVPPPTTAGLPPLVIRTHFSAGEGSASPAAWGTALAAAADGQPWRAILADRDDLCALPAAAASWGAAAVVPGATVRLGESAGHDAVVFAPDPPAYLRLCRFLSWRLESPADAAAWFAGDSAAGADLTGLVALVREDRVGARLERGGADVYCQAQTIGDMRPVSRYPVALVPAVSHVNAAGLQSEPLRRALADRQGRPLAASTATLAEGLAAARATGDAADCARSLLSRCSGLPPVTLHLPPSHYADASAELRRRAEAGARRRYGRITAEVRSRLDHELGVIELKGFCGYLLTVADLAAGRRTCGRGSGASSVVVYCLGITDVDPIRYRLLFERFLNPSRTDPPDLDIDFPWDERDAVLAAAFTRYGRDHVAMVATHQVLRRWGALRASARAFGHDVAATSAARAALTAEQRYGHAADLPGEWQGVVSGADLLEGSPWHLGLHCGGIVITPEPIRDLVPVHPAAKRIALEPAPGLPAEPTPIPAIAWEKDGAEARGLVKIDLLGNRSLAVIRDALADLAEDGIRIDEARWRPADDPATRRLVAAGDTMGCFYIESPAMRQLQAKAGSGDFDRLVIHSSIIRPAANRWIADYLKRLHHHRATGQHDPAWYPHPALRELLSESFGILSYQEDVMLAAVRLAGFDDRQANALRKALGHWDTQTRLTGFAAAFRAGAAARGVDPAAAEQVWANISSFAGYSFCKAHSASYAMVSFQCAYLKAHYPAYFLARVIANEGGFYAPGAYLEEARRAGLAIHGPCVMASVWATRREDAGSIRCGLHLVPDLGRKTAERLIAARDEGPFRGVLDLRRRTGLKASALGTLARAGALDALRPDLNRRQLVWLAETVALAPARFREEDDDGVIARCVPPPPDRDPEAPDLPAPTRRQAAWERFRTLGFLPDGHPIWFCPQAPGTTRCRHLADLPPGSRARILAWPITRKQVDAKPKAGGPAQPMAFVTVEDATGLAETVWFPAAYRSCGILLERNGPVLLDGVVEQEWGVTSLHVLRGEAAEPSAAG